MFLRETLCCEGIPTDVSYANPKDTNEIQMSAGSRGGALPSLGRRTRGFSSAAHLLQTLASVTTSVFSNAVTSKKTLRLS